jgi:hypothetical protein
MGSFPNHEPIAAEPLIVSLARTPPQAGAFPVSGGKRTDEVWTSARFLLTSRPGARG